VAYQAARRAEFDWLRVLALGLLFVFHSAMGFSDWPWHVKDTHHSWFLDNLLDFMLRWRVALVFIVSGAALMFALGVRTPRAILRERFSRLLIPLIFGMLAIVPPQVYLERVQHKQFSGSYLDFLPHIFDGFYPQGNLSWHHLWFIPYVLILTAAAMPHFAWARSPAGRRKLDPIMRAVAERHLYWLLVVPLALAELGMHVQGSDDHTVIGDARGWMQFATLMVMGGALALWPELLAAVQRLRFVSLIAAIVAYSALRAEWPPGELDPVLLPLPSAIGWCNLSALNVFAWVMTGVGFLTRWFNRPSPVLSYATEAAMPVYVLHQTLIVFAVYQLGHEHWPLPVKYIITFTFALFGSLALYELLIRRSSWLRVLFGVKPRARNIGAEVLVPSPSRATASVTSRLRGPSS